MRVMSGYLRRKILMRFAVLLIGGAFFALSFDLLENGSDVLRSTGEDWTALFRYGALRMPMLLSLLVPIAALLAGLLAFGDHLRHRELVAVWNSGASPFAILGGLLPACALLVGLQIVVDDLLVPHSAEALRDWGVDAELGAMFESTNYDVVWLRSGRDILRIPNPRSNAAELKNVVILRRDENGILAERLDVGRALHQGDSWRLLDVERQVVGGEATHLPELVWNGTIELEAIDLLSTKPQALSLFNLARIIAADGYGQRATSLYRTWLHARIASALVPALMLLLAGSLMQRFRRTGGFTRMFILGLTIGFSLLVFGRAAVAMGEVGFLPAWLAGWAATLVMGSLIGRFALHHEPSAL